MADGDFSIHNLPFGVFEADGRAPRAGVAFEDRILDLAEAAAVGHFDDLRYSRSLRLLPIHAERVHRARKALLAGGAEARGPIDYAEQDAPLLIVEQEAAKMLLPVEIGDYVDFYSSEEHADQSRHRCFAIPRTR